MTVAVEHPSGMQRDTNYQKAMASLHKGEWQAAIRGLEALLQAYPGNAMLANTLEEAQFKAHLDAETHIRAKRWAFAWQPLLMRILLLLMILFLLWQGARLVQSQIVPRLAALRAQRLYAQWLEEGNAYLKAGDFDKAEQQ